MQGTKATDAAGPPSTNAADPVPHAAGQSQKLVWIDQNAAIYILTWAAGLVLAYSLGRWWLALLVPGAFFAVTEALYFGLGIQVYSHTLRVKRAYEWFDIYLDGAFGRGRDLTEAYFDGDPSKPYEQALEDKFDKFIELLGLAPGDSLLDVGCGYGDFIAHAQRRGIRARGITLSVHHADLCRYRGLDVVCGDARDMPREFYGQFDAVTFLGCLEHFGGYVTHATRAPGDSFLQRTGRARHDRLLQSVYEQAFRCLKPSSRVRRVLSSTIHETMQHPKGVDWLHGYLVERHYSGLYPLGDDGLVKNSRRWFTEVYRRDASDDYRLASEVDPLHFGNFRVIWTWRRLALLPVLMLLDPFWAHKWLYYGLGSWMWQFGGIGGKPKAERPVTLWWFVLQARDEQDLGS